MTLAGLLVFATVYAVAVASPGPGVAAVVARVLGHGAGGIAAFISGFVLGDLIWFATAAAGLAALAQAFDGVFTVVRYAGAAYLLYVAIRLWTAPTTSADVEVASGGSRLRLCLGGLTLTLGNPKVIVFFMALLPTIVDLERLDAAGAAEIAAVIVVVLSAVLAGYAVAAARARRLFRSARAMRFVNRGAGAIMAGAAAAVAAR
jgi:threonine/homoserine/homoserine lactone efflux protein